MAYARMRVICKDALICDFAQYYHIYDLDSVNLQTAAILACGLPPDSRTLRQMTGQKFSAEMVIQMRILDTVRFFQYAYISSHSKRKVPKPQSIFEILNEKKEENPIRGFKTKEAFEAARERILKEYNHG